MEDWAYGAGWDKNKDATLETCDPRTYPLEANFFNKTLLDHIATSIYLIEMDDSKNPPESSYGARMIAADGAV